ncbi:MAG: flagellar M-ring protein FliF [Leptospiraceae bacterium]|nr:flagellar M-ring protein FliF [Leptospiraceae bacterium]
MPEQLKNLLNSAQELWGKLDNTKKITLGAVILVVAIAFASMSAFSSQPANVKLYEDLNQSDFSEITAALDAMGYAYNTSGASSIYVNPDQRDEIIVKLAQDNLIPVGAEGWDIFDISRWDETTFEKNVKLHRAMKGSLERMLMKLDFVKSATVELAVPQDNNFGTDTQPVKASVVIQLTPGIDAVTRKQVLGMKNLIYRAIPGLERDNISITDENGHEFAEPDELDLEERKLRLVEKKKEFEETERKKWQSEIHQSLTEFYPEDRISIVRVGLDINWDEVTEKQSLVFPVEMTEDNPDTPYSEREIMEGGTILVSRNAREEGFRGNGFTPGGPTGTEQQLPPGYRDLDYQRAEYKNRDAIENYEFNRSEREIVHQPWEMGPRSISVAVDGIWKRLEPKEDGSGWQREYSPPSPEELKTMEELLKASVLFKASRGDNVTVRHVQKDRTEQFRKEDEELQRQLMIRRLLIVSAISLAVFLLVFLLYRAIKKEIARRRRLREEELAAQQQLMREAALRVADEGAAEVELSVDEKARREMLENAINLAREKPDQVAKLLRTWLADEG